MAKNIKVNWNHLLRPFSRLYSVDGPTTVVTTPLDKIYEAGERKYPWICGVNYIRMFSLKNLSTPIPQESGLGRTDYLPFVPLTPK